MGRETHLEAHQEDTMIVFRKLVAFVCYRCAGTGGGCRDCG